MILLQVFKYNNNKKMQGAYYKYRFQKKIKSFYNKHDEKVNHDINWIFTKNYKIKIDK